MADGQLPVQDETTPGEESPPREQFDKTPEFAHFKSIMKRLLAVPKSEIDRKVRQAKKRSPRVGNPNAPGRKPSQR